ncbi:MAG: hypothetical protein KGI83_05805, partial [Verrucomicrobiota bacterium]|nr:hypothetical protein [Verrucomicrobiota bacterium]
MGAVIAGMAAVDEGVGTCTHSASPLGGVGTCSHSANASKRGDAGGVCAGTAATLGAWETAGGVGGITTGVAPGGTDCVGRFCKAAATSLGPYPHSFKAS